MWRFHHGLRLAGCRTRPRLPQRNNHHGTYVPSQEIKKFLEANGIVRVSVFEHGVDCRQFHPAKRSDATRESFGVEPDGVLVLYAGRLSKEKSLEQLLHCYLHLADRHPKARLVITGDGPMRPALVRRFARPGITFTGWKRGEELARLVASADIFALPSITETLSLVSLESMASGVPIVGMNAGGIRDIVEHQRTGLLANSGGEFDVFLRLLIGDVANSFDVSEPTLKHGLQAWSTARPLKSPEMKERGPVTAAREAQSDPFLQRLVRIVSGDKVHRWPVVLNGSALLRSFYAIRGHT